jgi:hypothetical protein
MFSRGSIGRHAVARTVPVAGGNFVQNFAAAATVALVSSAAPVRRRVLSSSTTLALATTATVARRRVLAASATIAFDLTATMRRVRPLAAVSVIALEAAGAVAKVKPLRALTTITIDAVARLAHAYLHTARSENVFEVPARPLFDVPEVARSFDVGPDEPIHVRQKAEPL